MVHRLYLFAEQINWTWRGQQTQAVVENWILITSLVLLSMAGVQLTLVSFGADRRIPFPLDVELAGIDALFRVGLPFYIAPNWTNHFNPYWSRLETRMSAVI